MDDSALLKAQKELDNFLSENPHLTELQNEIDNLKSQCGDDPLVSTVLIFEVIKESLREELIPSLKELAQKIDDLKRVTNKKDIAS
jgi:hypothetical protein